MSVNIVNLAVVFDELKHCFADYNSILKKRKLAFITSNYYIDWHLERYYQLPWPTIVVVPRTEVGTRWTNL